MDIWVFTVSGYAAERYVAIPAASVIWNIPFEILSRRCSSNLGYNQLPGVRTMDHSLFPIYICVRYHVLVDVCVFITWPYHLAHGSTNLCIFLACTLFSDSYWKKNRLSHRPLAHGRSSEFDSTQVSPSYMNVYWHAASICPAKKFNSKNRHWTHIAPLVAILSSVAILYTERHHSHSVSISSKHKNRI